jgi:leader peptidase (prepilin peptidase)/N-methyltransferase
MRIIATIFAALFGLAYGSFLNVCLSRWPCGESVVKPRSHCRNCGHTLGWWENLPLLSWMLLRGRCRRCQAAISWRYPLVELLVAALWAFAVWKKAQYGIDLNVAVSIIALLVFYWLLTALAFLDAENFWLPDNLTLGGLALGLATHIYFTFDSLSRSGSLQPLASALGLRLLACAIAAAIILIIRWLYWLVRRQEGMGLGDAKLMAMLAAWLGLPGALLSLFLAVMLGAAYALILLVTGGKEKVEEKLTAQAEVERSSQLDYANPETSWSHTHLPLGTFLCIGGVVSSIYGQRIISAYMHWAGF